MTWVRTRFGRPVILFHWTAGIAGILLLFACTLDPPFPETETSLVPLLIFLGLHFVASFLHFQFTRLQIVVTFESAFTTAALLLLGALPAVWIAVAAVVLGSLKRVFQRRLVLHKKTPLEYDLGIIVFNAGMTATMWLIAAAVYFLAMNADIPLVELNADIFVSILAMYACLSIINVIALYTSNFLQGQDASVFFRQAFFPAFLTEIAMIPYGILMALTYTRMGIWAFGFLAATLLLSNLLLRNMSLIRRDQEEKLRQLTGVNRISSKISSLRQEQAVLQLLYSEVPGFIDSEGMFVAVAENDGTSFRFLTLENSALASLAQHVWRDGQVLLIQDTSRHHKDAFKQKLDGTGIRSCLVVPIRTVNHTHGILGLTSSETGAFNETHIPVLMMIAGETALALENTRLYSDLTDKVGELERLNKELRQLDRMKSEFLANVSHELRTPLTTIKGYVEYMMREKMGPVTSAQNEGLIIAQRNILRLQRLINDLIDYTRLEFKRPPLSLAIFSFDQIWNQVYKEYAETIAQKKLSLHIMIPANLPLIFADTQLLTQALSSLISNALKFTQEGGIIWIEARKLEHATQFYDPDIYRSHCELGTLVPLEISIRDNGVGIPAEQQIKIFDKFYQVDSSHTRRYGGTGLGLAIVKTVMEAHGTKVQVHSNPEEGSAFTFVIAGMQPADVSDTLKAGQVASHQRPKYVT
jgi:signal transduction histidine kinase